MLPVDLNRAYERSDEIFSPRIAAMVNDHDVKFAKLEGEYVWHAHQDTDEFFLVLARELVLELEGRAAVRLGSLQLITVPAGQRHRPTATPGTRVLFIEPHGTLNSGDADLSEDPWAPLTTGVALDDGAA
jgi:mannose-6-phosphate isomerase-like protein (cupin superfamily)